MTGRFQRRKPVMFSIKERHAEAILEGEKSVEYRRTPPAAVPPYRIAIYASGGPKAVVGSAKVVEKISKPVDELIAATIDDVPGSRGAIEEYFAGDSWGSALVLDDAERLDDPIGLEELRAVGSDVSFPPQSFQYVEDDDVVELLEEHGL